MSQEDTATWIDAIRTCVQAMRRLLSGLELSRLHDGDGIHFIRRDNLLREYHEFERLVTKVPESTRLNSDAMAGLHIAWSITRKAEKLGHETTALMNYIEAIDPKYLEVIENDLSGVPRPKSLATVGNQNGDTAKPLNRIVQSLNDKRDSYIFRRKKARATFGVIAAEIKTHKDWEPLEGVKGVQEALKRYCKRTGKPYPVSQNRKSHKLK